MKEVINKIKKGVIVLLINLFIIAILLYSFEFLFNPYNKLPFNGRIDGQRYTWGHRVTNNKYGFRERNFETPKPKEIYRIAVFGDSLTWGAGLAVDERYTAIAEKLLNNAFEEKQFEVLNFGISGGPTVTERDLVKKFEEIVDPDLIVVGYCLNDPQPRGEDYSIEKDRLRKTTASKAILTISEKMQDVGLRYLAELLYDSYFLLAEKFGIIPGRLTALQRVYEPASDEWQQFLQALKDIKNVSDQRGLPSPIFTVLNQGTSPDKPTDYIKPDEYLEQYLRWYHQAEEAADNIGFIAYNHEAEISRQLRNEPLSVNVVDGHPSVNLNRIYGIKLYEMIAKIITQH